VGNGRAIDVGIGVGFVEFGDLWGTTARGSTSSPEPCRPAKLWGREFRTPLRKTPVTENGRYLGVRCFAHSESTCAVGVI